MQLISCIISLRNPKMYGGSPMANVPDRLPLMNRPDSSWLAQSVLNGSPLSPTTLLLARSSVIGSLLFTVVYLIEGATRPGYDPWRQAISALSLGPGGWVQQANFVVFGVLTLISAFGWRQVLKPRAGAIWFPILQGTAGLGLIIAGFFSQDPAPGYP